MLKLFIIIAAIMWASCQKEISQEGDHQTCGIVVSKLAVGGQRSIDVDYSGTIVTEQIGLFQFAAINLGDTFCK